MSLSVIEGDKVFSPILDFKQIPATDVSFDNSDYVDFGIDGGLPASGPEHRFIIPTSQNHSYDLSRAYIELRLRCILTAGGNLDQTTSVAIQNSFPFYASASYTSGADVIETKNYMHYDNYLRDLLDLSRENAVNGLHQEGFFLDRGTGLIDMNDISISGTIDTNALVLTHANGANVNLLGLDGFSVSSNPNFNPGFKSRRQLGYASNTNYSGYITVRRYLSRMFDSIGENSKMIPADSPEQTFVFNRQTSDVNTILSADGLASLDILQARLWVPKVILSNSGKKEYYLQTTSPIAYLYKFQGSVVKQVGVITNGSTVGDMSTTVQVPDKSRITKVCVFYVPTASHTTQTANQNVFTSANITGMTIGINDSIANYPATPIKCSFARGAGSSLHDTTRIYQSYIDLTRKASWEDMGRFGAPAITQEEFETLFPMFWFDLSSLKSEFFTTSTIIYIHPTTSDVVGAQTTCFIAVWTEQGLMISFEQGKMTSKKRIS